MSRLGPNVSSRCTTLVYAMTVAILLWTPASAQMPVSCASACWTLRLKIVELPDHVTADKYTFDVTLGADERPVTIHRDGATATVLLPRVVDAYAVEQGLSIVLRRTDIDDETDLELELPGYVRATQPMDILFSQKNWPGVSSSVNALAAGIGADRPSSSQLWKTYFEAERLLPQIAHNPFLSGKLQKVIFNTCSKLARDKPTWIVFRMKDNDCHENDTDLALTDKEKDDVAMTPWLFFDYSVDALNNIGDPSTHGSEFGGVYRTLRWLDDLHNDDAMKQEIQTHVTLNNDSRAPAPSDQALAKALEKGRCKVQQSC